MSRRRGYWERNSHGNERVFFVNRARSSSHTRSARELLQESEEREQALIAQVASLTTRLSYSERNEWALHQQHTALVHEHHGCRQLRAQVEAHASEHRRLDGLLLGEEDKNDRLREKIKTLEEKARLLKRTIVPDYKGRYEAAMRDVDILTQKLVEKNEELRLKDLRIDGKERTIAYMRDYLQQRGYTVRHE